MTPPVGRGTPGPGCEVVATGVLGEPVAALTSLAFVVAGLVVALGARSAGGTGRVPAARRPAVLTFAALVAAVGVGSVIDHGPDPGWSDVVHDVPLLATLAFVGADAAADLAERTATPRWWWVVPVVVLLPAVVLVPRLADLAQAGVAAVAVALTVVRAAARPGLRRRIAAALALLVVGAVTGTLSRAGWPLCDPASPWQGHGAWHVLAAAALVVLAPTVGARGATRTDPGGPHPGRPGGRRSPRP